MNRFGGLDFLLNNAGVLHVGNAEQITEEQWDHTFNLNVRSVWLLSRAALPHMRRSRRRFDREYGFRYLVLLVPVIAQRTLHPRARSSS